MAIAEFDQPPFWSLCGSETGESTNARGYGNRLFISDRGPVHIWPVIFELKVYFCG